MLFNLLINKYQKKYSKIIQGGVEFKIDYIEIFEIYNIWNSIKYDKINKYAKYTAILKMLADKIYNYVQR